MNGKNVSTYTTNTVNNVWPASTAAWPAKRVWDDLFMIGFDKLWDKTINNTGFPFYNVSKISEDEFEVELALSGFAAEDVEIQEHKSSLIITGNRNDADKDYMYKGISSKSFTRTFALAEHVHVKDARMENGMLMIVLRRDVPEEAKPKNIKISK